MGSTAGDQLRSEAGQLTTLADDVRAVLDAAKKRAEDQFWRSPNADDVRGQLNVFKQKCGSMADALAGEATTRTQQASKADGTSDPHGQAN